ncbi:MAG: hypothetical protein HXX14_00220 [Bacteroidetes bacterium]|nr:hypothetical protein [Bacteroidota bacterium]
MGEITGPFRFKGSVGNFRSYYNSAAKKWVVATKGGANKDLIYNHPAFARTRENMSDFGICGKWASLIRMNLFDLDELNSGYYFSGITKLAKVIQTKDREGKKGQRSIISSKYKNLITSINFNDKYPFREIVCRVPEIVSDDLRQTIIINMPHFSSFSELNWFKTYYFYRFTLTIGQLSDYIWVKEEDKFKLAHENLEDTRISVRTEWLSNNTDFTDISLIASFKDEAIPADDVTVLVALGIEFASKLSDHTLAVTPGDGTMALVACL